MKIDIVTSVPVQRSVRVQQMSGIFDLPPDERSESRWTVDFDPPAAWSIGVIVGPSGSGKTTVAKRLFAEHLVGTWSWPEDQSILDGFPKAMGIKAITALLSSVGFSSPPAWLRPFHALSNGEQFRVGMARTLAESADLAVVDEFTSVVDRTVAQIGSAAIAKTVRKHNKRFVAVTCHYDVLDWLEPDWVYQPHLNVLSISSETDRLWRRPPIELSICRVGYQAWRLFRQHHYLNTQINQSSACFLATWHSTPVAFTSWLAFPHHHLRKAKRGHRTVCLPDYQGVGIGNAICDTVASMYAALGYLPISTTSHPGMIGYRAASPHWQMTRVPSQTATGPLTGSFAKSTLAPTRANLRLTAGFRYIGPPMEREKAACLLGD